MCDPNDLKNNSFVVTIDVDREREREHIFGDESSRGGSSIS
jgi:hypothetical protein